jgi:hypothetical protein
MDKVQRNSFYRINSYEVVQAYVFHWKQCAYGLYMTWIHMKFALNNLQTYSTTFTEIRQVI